MPAGASSVSSSSSKVARPVSTTYTSSWRSVSSVCSLDDVVAGVLGRVRVDAERLDPERPSERLPLELARHRDRRRPRRGAGLSSPRPRARPYLPEPGGRRRCTRGWWGADHRTKHARRARQARRRGCLRGARAHASGIAFRVALVAAGDRRDAEEAVQDGFVKAYRALGRFRDGAPFRPWLLQIVANEARNRRRSAGRRTGLALRVATAASGDAAPSPEAAALTHERRQELLDALDSARRARS